MGFKRVVASISDADLEKLCMELGLEDTIIPARTISRHLENMVRGLEDIELSTLLKADARIFTLTAGKKEATSVEKLELPADARVIFYYREDEFHFVEENTKFNKGDQIIILTRSKNLTDLKKRWNPEKVND